MFRSDLSLQKFRLFYFPMQFTLEIALAVLFLVLKVYSENVPLNFGVFTLWGWLLASASVITAIILLLLFLSSVSFQGRAATFFNNEKVTQNLAYFLAYFCLLRIGLIAISLLYVTPLYFDRTVIYLIIFGLSIFPPFLLYFVANSLSLPEKTFALSSDAPLSIKLTAFWLLFLTGAMQILSEEYTILVIGLILLLVSYFFFNLYPLAIVVTPLLLLIHAGFSIFLSVVVLIQIDNPEILANIYTKPELILVIILFFILPSVLSLVLTGTFFRKKLYNWVRSIHPSKEMEIDLPYSYEDEDDEEDEEE